MKKILIIEDEKPLRNALSVRLANSGFIVSTASDGLEGLSAVDKDTPDLILLDILMPKADGLRFLEALENKDIKILVLSNLMSIDKIMKDMKVKVDGILIKADTSLETLVQTIRDILK